MVYRNHGAQIDLTIKLVDILMDVQLVQAIQQTQIQDAKLCDCESNLVASNYMNHSFFK